MDYVHFSVGTFFICRLSLPLPSGAFLLGTFFICGSAFWLDSILTLSTGDIIAKIGDFWLTLFGTADL